MAVFGNGEGQQRVESAKPISETAGVQSALLVVATYNVNGVHGRLPRLLEWLRETSPDVVCLQELKTDDTKFPAAAIHDAGYGAIWHGQRAHHGVAIVLRKYSRRGSLGVNYRARLSSSGHD